MINTWWLAIDKKYTSYEELKHRKVVAQGWPELGDLRTLLWSSPNGHFFKLPGQMLHTHWG